jgi:DNA-directed RNA polymerase specialized sigma24 family protein
MYVGATREEAEDAADETLEYMLRRWDTIIPTRSFARTAVVSNFLKAKTRGPLRVARRLVERGHVSVHEGAEDSQLAWPEYKERLEEMLSILTPAQRKVMLCIAMGIDRGQIAERLDMRANAVSRHLSDARKRFAGAFHPDGKQKQPPAGITPRKARKESR